MRKRKESMGKDPWWYALQESFENFQFNMEHEGCTIKNIIILFTCRCRVKYFFDGILSIFIQFVRKLNRLLCGKMEIVGSFKFIMLRMISSICKVFNKEVSKGKVILKLFLICSQNHCPPSCIMHVCNILYGQVTTQASVFVTTIVSEW